MENTIENKAKFIAFYWGQYVGMYKFPFEEILQGMVDEKCFIDIAYLVLTPLSQITDEDAIEVIKILQSIGIGSTAMREPKEYLLNGSLMNQFGTFQLMAPVVDYLRSKGYALPWMGLSVEQLVEYGWIRLKE